MYNWYTALVVKTLLVIRHNVRSKAVYLHRNRNRFSKAFAARAISMIVASYVLRNRYPEMLRTLDVCVIKKQREYFSFEGS